MFGYTLGAITGLLLAGFTGQLLLNNFLLGLAPGASLMLLLGHYFNHLKAQKKMNMLFPIPLTYPLPVKQIFPSVKKAVREFVYEGKTFRILPTNTSQAIEIKADITWSDTDEIPEPTKFDASRVRRERVDRHIRLEIFFDSPSTSSTTVEIHWYPMSKGLNENACDPIIEKLNDELRSILGEGSADLPLSQPWLAPSWMHITASLLLGLYMISAFFGACHSWFNVYLAAKKSQSESYHWKAKNKTLITNLNEFEDFKRNYKPKSPNEPNNIWFTPAPPPVSIKPSTKTPIFNTNQRKEISVENPYVKSLLENSRAKRSKFNYITKPLNHYRSN